MRAVIDLSTGKGTILAIFWGPERLLNSYLNLSIYRHDQVDLVGGAGSLCFALSFCCLFLSYYVVGRLDISAGSFLLRFDVERIPI
jgi:hypothetical protein